jgi:hypothetical protein
VRCFRLTSRLHESIKYFTTGGPKVFDPSIGRATQFRKGQPSPNPGGRPKARLLSEALRNRLAEVRQDDPAKRTWAEIIATNLIEIASSKSPSAVSAANEISDRIEGRSRQSIEVSDISADLRSKSDEELRFHLEHDRWPSDEEKTLLFTPSQHATA